MQASGRHLLVALFAAALGAGGVAHAGRAKGSSFETGVADADARVQSLQKHWASSKKVTAVKVLGGRSAKVMLVRTDADHFIIRQPKRGVAQGVRVNLAQQKLAAQLGEYKLVPSAIADKTKLQLGEVAIGTEVMVVHFAGKHYVNASDADAPTLAKVPEQARLVGALVDLLSEQRDRKSANIMVNHLGEIRLIDPDKSFGQKGDPREGETENPAFRSNFFHGGKVGYTTSQARFHDLPAQMQHVIEDIADSSIATLTKVYGLNAEEAGIMQSRASRVRELGLQGAIDEYVTSLGTLRKNK